MTMATRNQREAITIQLVPGKDDDLIRWLSRVDKGKRDPAIKAAIRDGLKMPQPAAQQAGAEVSPLMLQQMQEFASVFAERMGWVEQWVGHFNQQIEAMSNSYRPAEQASVLEVAPRMAQEDLTKRAAKIKKVKW